MKAYLRAPYYKKDGIEIYFGDAIEVMAELVADKGRGFASAVVTDPPYGLGVADWDAVVPYDGRVAIESVTSGPVVWFGGAGKVDEMGEHFRAIGLPWQRLLIWAPKFTMSHTIQHGVAYRWQPMACWRIPPKHLGPTWDVVDTPTETRKQPWQHPGMKPVKLLQLLCGFAQASQDAPGLVLDPYMGSGTTLAGARIRKLSAIGIDFDKTSCEMAVDRIERERRQIDLW